MSSSTEYDVVVIGGGPAGAGTALRLAHLGHRVLLLERQKLPRFKVCGGCIHRQGVLLLERWGVSIALQAGGAEPLQTLTLVTRGATARFAHPHGVVVDRTRFDAALIRCAQSANAVVRDQTSAKVVLTSGDGVVTLGDGERVHSRAIVVADGLGGSALPRGREWMQTRQASSHIGLGAWVDDEWLQEDPSDGRDELDGIFKGEVRMHLSCGGYVGAVRQRRDGRAGTELAAAASPALLREHRDPARVVRQLLDEAGATSAWLRAAGRARWRVTPPLTCRRPVVSQQNVLILGDSAGYTEPITGQGITWALASADRLAMTLDAYLRAETSLVEASNLWQRWMRRHRMIHHARCRWTARLLRHPSWVHACVRITSAVKAWNASGNRPCRAGAAV